MNFMWIALVCMSLILLIVFNPAIAFDSMLRGSEKAIALALKLWAIYAVWLGILKIVEDTRLDQKIARLLSPIIDLLFGKTSIELKEQIAINITSNLLGMGNASTPSGIKSIELMDDGTSKITTAMAMLIILNTSSIQLLPTTVIGLRITAGSLSPNNIILPTLIATASSTLCGIILVKLCAKIFHKERT